MEDFPPYQLQKTDEIRLYVTPEDNPNQQGPTRNQILITPNSTITPPPNQTPINTNIPEQNPIPNTTNSIPDPNQTQNNIPNPNQTQNNIPSPNQTQNNIPNPNQTQNNIPNPNQTQNNIPNPNQTQNNIPNPNQTQNNTPNPNQTQNNIPNPNSNIPYPIPVLNYPNPYFPLMYPPPNYQIPSINNSKQTNTKSAGTNKVEKNRSRPYEDQNKITKNIAQLGDLKDRMAALASATIHKIDASKQPGHVTMRYRRQILNIYSQLKDALDIEMRN